MTIEIRQLVIRAVVEPTRDPRRADATDARTADGAMAKPRENDATEAIVATCVREVLRALRRARGR